MIISPKKQDVDQWSQSLHSYQKGKRTKRPFGKKQPEIQRSFKSQYQDKQLRYNPILQSFKDERQLSKTIQIEQIGKMKDQLKYIQNNYRYNADYDIINFHPTIAIPEKHKSQSLATDTRKKQYKDPTYNGFDIINGQNYQKDYLEKRQLKSLKNYQRKIINKNQRVYNIINGTYAPQDRQNSSRITNSDSLNISRQRSSLDNSRQRSYQYDPISCQYYNPQQEQQYQIDMKQKSMNHGHDLINKLPPSYRFRQSVELSPLVPTSPIVQQLDLKAKAAKERYRQKYQIQQEYKMRNEYDDQKRQQLAKNRVHNGRMLESKTRQFNILNARPYDSQRTQKLYEKEVNTNAYDLRPYARAQSPIKQSGFEINLN